MDEPFHALAAAEYAIAGTYFANLEHPPLAKLLAGLRAVRAAGRARHAFRGRSRRGRPSSRARSLLRSPLRPDALLAAARRPFSGSSSLLVLAVGGRRPALGRATPRVSSRRRSSPSSRRSSRTPRSSTRTSRPRSASSGRSLSRFSRSSAARLSSGPRRARRSARALAAKFSGVLLVPVVAVRRPRAASSASGGRAAGGPDARCRHVRRRARVLAGAAAAAVLFALLRRRDARA